MPFFVDWIISMGFPFEEEPSLNPLAHEATKDSLDAQGIWREPMRAVNCLEEASGARSYSPPRCFDEPIG
jgi:hypothetical protein